MDGTFEDVLRETQDSWRKEFPEHDGSPVLLFMRLGYLSRRLQHFHDAVLRSHGRTLSEYQMLATLRMNGAQSPTRLNGLLMLTRAGVTNTVDRLEQAGLVRRRADGEDGRSIRIQLTARGTRHAETLLLAEREAQEALLADVGRDDRRAIDRAMESLVAAFDAPANRSGAEPATRRSR